MIHTLLLFLLSAFVAAPSSVVYDKTVYDFGTVYIKDGPVSCSFKVTNTGDESIYIQAVVSSCGCTNVKWTRTEIKSGESGSIDATYSNDEGPYPFDKTLTVYTSSSRRPQVLHIRGKSVKGSRK